MIVANVCFSGWHLEHSAHSSILICHLGTKYAERRLRYAERRLRYLQAQDNDIPPPKRRDVYISRQVLPKVHVVDCPRLDITARYASNPPCAKPHTLILAQRAPQTQQTPLNSRFALRMRHRHYRFRHVRHRDGIPHPARKR